MTDKELLSLAAKAAGYEIGKWVNNWMDQPELEGYWLDGDNWNPLTDDGDAFRLGVKLHLFKATEKAHWLIDDKTDFYAATRRTMTCAAAEIGKGIQQKSTQNLPEDNFYKTQAEAFYGAVKSGNRES